ncbi:MAG: tautomerase family protein [Burkholderiaceae bacterium]
MKLSVPESVDTTKKAAAVLTQITAEVLGKSQELTAVVVEYVQPQNWFVAGASLLEKGSTSMYLDIKITEGTNTKDEKAYFVAKVFSSLEAIVGPLAMASYVVIHDVRADSWGNQGETKEYRYIQGAQVQSRDSADKPSR